MKAKDVIHLYLGHKATHNLWKDRPIGKLTNVNEKMATIQFTSFDNDFPLDKIKLILRPLSDMTEEEYNQAERFRIYSPQEITFEWAKYAALSTLWFIEKDFDIFNLHESGECLYESDLANV